MKPNKDTQGELHEDINSILVRKGYAAVPIVQNAAGLLLITVVVNDVPGLFILDTGAAVSIVEVNYIERFKLDLKEEDASFSGAGAGGQGLKVVPSMGNKVEIGDYAKNDFMLTTMSLEHGIQALAQLGAHEEILGIIGVDILKPARAIIDYSSMTLYLSIAEK